MATVLLYGPYYVITTPENSLKPGDVGGYNFGPWPDFGKGTVTVSVVIGDYSSGDRRAITVENLEYSMEPPWHRYVRFSYRNTGPDPILSWYFNLTVVVP